MGMERPEGIEHKERKKCDKCDGKKTMRDKDGKEVPCDRCLGTGETN